MLIAVGGVLLGVLSYHYVTLSFQHPDKRHERVAQQLAIAQLRHERRQAVSGPAFPRAYMHINRIAVRAYDLLQELEAAEWGDRTRKQKVVEDMGDLLRHCQELADVMRPARGHRPSPMSHWDLL